VAAANAGDVSINGVTITIATNDTLEMIRDKINAVSAQSGASATINGVGIGNLVLDGVNEIDDTGGSDFFSSIARITEHTRKPTADKVRRAIQLLGRSSR